MKVRAFAGVESGWSKGGTNAAFIVSVLRYNYGDDFTFSDLQNFIRNNTFTDANGYEVEWSPRSDLLADGVLVGWGDGQIFIPDGFDTTGWANVYSKWKSGQSIATLPKQPAPPPPPPQPEYEAEEDDYNAEYDYAEGGGSSYNPPPPQYTQPATAPTPAPMPSPVPSQTALTPIPTQPGTIQKKSDNMPLLIIGGLIAAAVVFGGKGKGRRR